MVYAIITSFGKIETRNSGKTSIDEFLLRFLTAKIPVLQVESVYVTDGFINERVTLGSENARRWAEYLCLCLNHMGHRIEQSRGISTLIECASPGRRRIKTIFKAPSTPSHSAWTIDKASSQRTKKTSLHSFKKITFWYHG